MEITVPIDFDPFAGPALTKIVPTTEAQLEIFASCLIGGEDASRSYNESISLQLNGNLDIDSLRFAINTVVNRHEALRSTFSTDGKTMAIYEEVPVEVFEEDISDRDDQGKAKYILDFKRRNALTAFDLTNGPLFRVAVFKLSNEEHHFTFTAHHLVCDGWSLGVILMELSKVYSATIKNELYSLQDVPQYSEYAQEQVVFEKTAEFAETENYWLKQFEPPVPVFDIPTDYVRPALRTYKSNRDDYPLSRDLVASVKKMGAEAGCSLVVTLLSAFEIFLHKISGQKDVIIGLPSAGQSATEKFELVGHCVNLLPLRTHIHPGDTFTGYLKQRRKQFFNDLDHQRFTFGSLLKKIKIPRDTSRVPLVPIMFNIDMGMSMEVAFEGLSYKLISNPREYETFEIFLNATGTEQALILEWSYNARLFKPSTIKRMMDEYQLLLETLVSNPSVQIKELKIQTAEVAGYLEKWNDTKVDYPREQSLPALIHDTALQYAEKTAVEFKQQQLSYQMLDEQSSRLANLFIKEGVSKGQAIGLAVDRSEQMIIALLAIMKSGACYVPLDPEYPKDRIEYMLEDSKAAILLTSKKYSGHFNSGAKELIAEDCFASLPHYKTDYPCVGLTGQDLAYILYTSGSTGKPKGVQIKHHNLVNFLLSMKKQPGITEQDSLLAITTISFDIAGLELYLPLISGAKVLLADSETARDAYRLLALLNEKKATIMQATPSTWRMLLDSGWTRPFDFKILCGGEALPKDIAEKLLPLCNSLWNMYGPTETTIWSTVKEITADEPVITIGRPIDNTQVYILDEYLNNVPIGATGEIYIGGDGLAKGYFDREELTAERFVSDPFAKESGARMYRTGDLGRFVENGEIQCLGRIDQQVKIRGHRIELGEIEHSLSKLEGIREAVVIAREDNPGNQKLAAYVIPEGKDLAINFDSKEQKIKWRDAIREVLPPYMVPNDWVILSEFPLTPNNKIDKKALPQPTVELNGHARKSVRLPYTKNEKLIASIWEEELGVKDVTLDDDFFDLGGHSLIAVKMMNHLEKETGKRIPLTALFEGPTIEKLASLVDKDDHSWDSFVSIKSTGNKTPIYLIHGVGLNVLIFSPLAKYLNPEQPIYGIQAKGLNGIDKMFGTMEEIAAHYIKEIMARNPDGPYAIGGYSFGGLIAFEMSKQWKAMGKDVILTCMFDSCAYESFSLQPLPKRVILKSHEIFMRIVWALIFMTKEPKIVIQNKIRYAQILFRQFLDKFSSKKEVPKDKYTEYSKRATQMYNTAFNKYRLTPYDGRVDVFRSKKQTYYMPDFKYLGWKPYARQGVVVHEVPGYHLDMFKSPNVEEFAKTLQACLDKATEDYKQKKKR
jgi:amino acid adenylation domain-containing protein